MVSLASMAQDEIIPSENPVIDETPRQKLYYLFSPRVSITVPHPLGNNSFKRSFVGIYEINAGLNLMMYKGFFIGGAYKNGLLKITENKIPDYDASMAINNVAGKIGNDFYIGSKNNLLLSASVSVGQNYTKFSSFKSKDPQKYPSIKGFKSIYIEPEADMFFLVESNFGIGLTFTYSIIQRNFDPYELCLNEWAQFDKNNSGSTRYLSFGFGFYYGISQKTTQP